MKTDLNIVALTGLGFFALVFCGTAGHVGYSLLIGTMAALFVLAVVRGLL